MVVLVAHLDALAELANQMGGAAANILQAQRAYIAQQIEATQLSVADAAAIATAVSKVPFGKGDRDHLFGLLAARTAPGAEGAGSANSRVRQQNYAEIASYFTASQWEVLRSDREQASRKLEEVVQQAAQLQLRCPTESTLQSMTGLFLLVSEGAGRASGLAPRIKLESLRHLRRVFKATASRAPQKEWVQELPANPSELQARHASVWQAVFGGVADLFHAPSTSSSSAR